MEDWVVQLEDYARRALRPFEGNLDAPGLDAEVEVFTDQWGVPHVYAQNRADLYFAQGYLHAAERLWQIDLTRRYAQGRLSEWFGELTLPLDRFHRTLGLGRTAQTWVDKIDDDTRRVSVSYHAGFKAAALSLPKPVEYQILGIEPEIGATLDESIWNTLSIAMLMAFLLSTNWDFELLRARLAKELGAETARLLTPFVGNESPAVVPASDSFAGLVQTLTEQLKAAGGAAPGTGSNNWVVAGSRTSTGKPLLANDPHLKIGIPCIWMEMHLACPDMEVAGVTLPGAPGVIIGHNRRLAWGFTNTGSDVEDLYLEKLSDDGAQYEYQGSWHPVEIVREEIVVRNEPEPRVHEVKTTRHGPLLTSIIQGDIDQTVIEGAIKDALALRWIHYDVVSTQRAIEGMNLASNWEEFREATKEWPSAGQNIVYADVDGNIGYQFTGQVPLRSPGTQGTAPLPGWTGEHEWQGTIPFDHLPSVLNPEIGFVATANNRMVDLDYPYYVTHDWEPPYRIRRIVSLLSQSEKLTIEDFKRIQMDTYSGIAGELLPFLLGVDVSDGKATDAFKEVELWDRRMDPQSIGAATFVVWVTELADRIFRPKLGDELYDAYFRLRSWTTLWAYDTLREILKQPEARWVGGDGSDNAAARDALIREALQEACVELEDRLGPHVGEWRWGRLHQVHFRHPLTTAMPPLDELLSAGPFEAPGGDDTVNRGVSNPGEDYAESAVSSYRQIIDLSDFDRSLSIITSGNSGNPASPYYRDQAEMWLTGEYHPMPFSREAVEKASVGRLTLGPSARS